MSWTSRFAARFPAGRKRAVVQKRDGVFAVLLFQPEQVAHGLDGNEDARVGAVIAVLPDLAEHADNFEANAIEQDGRTHRRASGKYVFQKLPADHGHSPGLRVVRIIEPAARANRDIADPVILGRNAKDLAVGGTVITDRANVFAVEHGRNILEQASLGADGEVILVSEMVGAAGLSAAFHRGDTSGEGEHDVLAKVAQLLRLTAAEAFSHTNQQEERSDAPGNAEHGKKRAELVGPEGGQGLANDFDQHPHDWSRRALPGWAKVSAAVCQ